MDFNAYTEYFQEILNREEGSQLPPYDNADYLNYAKLNFSRSKRWLKTAVLSSEVQNAVDAINFPQKWIVITEPWCGDAAHVIPFIQMIAARNPNIEIDYELRDAEPFRIEKYLTRGGRSIPKLIIKDTEGNDLATWGPRPAGCQVLYDTLVLENKDFETVKTEIQNWYNNDKGNEIMAELTQVILSTSRQEINA